MDSAMSVADFLRLDSSLSVQSLGHFGSIPSIRSSARMDLVIPIWGLVQLDFSFLTLDSVELGFFLSLQSTS